MRRNKFDSIKGILIILTVFAHFLYTYDYVIIDKYNTILSFIYLFHMPLFFLISGHFSKKTNKNNIIKIFLFFIFMNLSFTLYDYFIYGSLNIIDVKYSSWYLLLLFLYRFVLTNKYVSKYLSNKKSLIFTFVLSIFSGFIFNHLIISRLLYFLFFFHIGYIFNFKFSKKKSILIGLLSLVLLFVSYINISSINILMGLSYTKWMDILVRLLILVSIPLLYFSLVNLLSNKKIYLITDIGKNSLYIYALHRIITLFVAYYFYCSKSYLIVSIFLTILICIIINKLSKILNIIFKEIILIIIFFGIILLFIYFNNSKVLNPNEQDRIDNSISIGFVGDLLLLEDQLKLSNNNFDYMFDNMKEYFNNTDYTIGVLEGPVDDDNDYSVGNFDDGKELKLNYPTNFIRSIKDSGIDLVSISNNHIFDRGIDSYNKTLSNLKSIGLDYVGKKNSYQIIDVQGVRIGFLSYTYGVNNTDDNDYDNYINFLVDPNSEEFINCRRKIHKDFFNLKVYGVDMIVVLPHYGTQFSSKIDSYQKLWNDYFIEEGANIILGDHTHVLGPIQYKDNSIIVSSPGNYVNSYIGNNSDISAYIKVYFNKDAKKIVGSSLTPIVSTKDKEGKYYPEVLNKSMDKSTKKRVLDTIGSTIYRDKIKRVTDTYYYLPSKGVKYKNKYSLVLNDKDKESYIYKSISSHNKICFIGDSITEGAINNNHPWYEPLISFFDKEVVNISKSSYTSSDIIDNFSKDIEESDCDLTIINIGTNDIRYNALSPKKYIKNVKKIISLTDNDVVVLAPWETTSKDYNIDKNDKVKRGLYNKYKDELKKLDNAYYIDPNTYINKLIRCNGEDYFLLDGVHPNEDIGIKLYSFATMRS